MQVKNALLTAALLTVTCAVPTTPQPTKACNRDNCFRQLIQKPEVVGPFCATYTQTVNTVAAALPTFVSQCQGLASRVSSACSCLHPATTTSVSTTTPPVTTTSTTSSVATPTTTLPPVQPRWINYTTVTGIFLQDDESTNPTGFDYTQWNFGLKNISYPTDTEADAGLTQWQRFDKYLKSLNEESGDNVDYKVLFMGRHGEGYHNAAESYFGTPAWNCYWSLIDGNATVTWADALVTPEGIHQAEIAHDYYASRFKDEKLPFFDAYYSSPLTRCLETARITFEGQDLPADKPFIPTVKEYLREGISGHTCDRRRSKTYIHNGWPYYKFEEGFTENDELYRDGYAEGGDNQDVRNKPVLDAILGNTKDVWISISSHSGEITSLLRVLKHRAFRLATGGIIPVLVKVEREPPPAPVLTTTSWSLISTCATPPPLPTATP